MKRYIRGYNLWLRQQKRGILALLSCCVLLQLVYSFADFSENNNDFSQQEVLVFQQRIDSLKEIEQSKKFIINPFNPNFISDYKAYILGLSAEELKRLQDFRATGKYVNSAKEFQKVTHISDSLLSVISPLFKFPEWVHKKHSDDTYTNETQKNPSVKIVKKDLNTASAEDLLPIYGIGEKLSQRIIKYRERLHGFSHKKQLNEIYGLSPEVISEIWKYFDLLSIPEIIKLNINEASRKELSKIPYLHYKEVDEILLLRSEKGNITSLEELENVGFSKEKIEQLSWYLQIQK